MFTTRGNTMSKTCKHYFDYDGLGKWTCRNCGEQKLTNEFGQETVETEVFTLKEKIIEDVLMFRTSPTGEWKQCSITHMGKCITRLETYRNYIESNLERIADGSGWTPVCFDEFTTSDEYEDYYKV